MPRLLHHISVRYHRVRIPASSQGLWSKNGKYEYCYHFSYSDFMPSEGDLDARGPTAKELQAFIS